MPEPLTTIKGVAAPIPNHNIDTDVIMPKRFLRTITREGLADGALADLRFHEDGTKQNDFILNKHPWDQSKILIVGDNFGCGSSREHAVWGLYQLGIRVLIGTSFAGIFYDNCRRNGLAAICVDHALRDHLLKVAENPEYCEIHVDLANKEMEDHQGTHSFDIPEAIRQDLIEGSDAINTTLNYADKIRAFEGAYWG